MISAFLQSVVSACLRPRAVNAALAAWLLTSVFVFPHSPAQRVISLLSGIAVLILALLARRSFLAHRTVAAVAFGVLLSLFFFWPQQPATALNNTAIALAMAVLACLNPDRFSTSRRRWV